MIPSLVRLHEHAAVSGNLHGPLELENVSEDVLRNIFDYVHEPVTLREFYRYLTLSNDKPILADLCLQRAETLERAAEVAELGEEAANGTLSRVRKIEATSETMLDGVLNLMKGLSGLEDVYLGGPFTVPRMELLVGAITAGSLVNCTKLTLGGDFRGDLLEVFSLAIQTGKMPFLRELNISYEINDVKTQPDMLLLYTIPTTKGKVSAVYAGMRALAKAFTSGYMNNLREIELCLHEDEDGVNALRNAFRDMPRLEILRLSGIINNAKLLMNSIAGGGLAGLKTLAVDLQLKDIDIKAFCEGLPSGSLKNLRELTLSDNMIGNEGMVAFFSDTTLQFLPSLERLKLDDNKIGYMGIAAFADAVNNNALLPNLKQVSLDHQPYATIGPKHAWIEAREKLKAACESRNIIRSAITLRLTAQDVAQLLPQE